MGAHHNIIITLESQTAKFLKRTSSSPTEDLREPRSFSLAESAGLFAGPRVVGSTESVYSRVELGCCLRSGMEMFMKEQIRLKILSGEYKSLSKVNLLLKLYKR